MKQFNYIFLLVALSIFFTQSGMSMFMLDYDQQEVYVELEPETKENKEHSESKDEAEVEFEEMYFHYLNDALLVQNVDDSTFNSIFLLKQFEPAIPYPPPDME